MGGCYYDSRKKSRQDLTVQSVSKLITSENVESLKVVGGLPGATSPRLYEWLNEGWIKEE
ncbi:hypothetical protein ASD40_33515 [Paenibacillus sp. Root444D2]|nr:hypothetical protein ASD40_33515 [Paenibacillus sp. Root444D2]KRE41228.1 hypothetical protein ASG85_34180 [Paenibacillus sp. Soil724D2]